MSKKPSSKHSKVRFGEEVILDEHKVQCDIIENNCGEVHIGLLTVHNTYEVKFDVKHFLGSDLDVPPLQIPGIEITSLEILGNDDGHNITANVKINVEGSFKESMIFENSKNEQLKITFIATIMDSSRGTPSLKTGIKLLHKFSDDMSDANTEWEGFTR